MSTDNAFTDESLENTSEISTVTCTQPGVPQSSSDRDVGTMFNEIETEASACLMQENIGFKQEHVEGARPLVNVGLRNWSSILLDVFLCLLPVAFVVIATLALSLHDAPKSPSGDRIQSITLLAPTAFPIVYAAILGRALRRIGVFSAEKGATIGTLERLIGCQSLFSTIERQFGMRHIDKFGIIMMLVWVLSPVGGQSSLRLLSYQPRIITLGSAAWYYPVEAYPFANMVYYWDAFQFHHVSVPYMTAIQYSTQNINSSMDMWGNVKIPAIKSLGTYRSDEHSDLWHKVTNESGITYSSLFGIPIIGLPKVGNTTFSLISHYWDIEVKNVRVNVNVTFWNTSESVIFGPAEAASTYVLRLGSGLGNLTYYSRGVMLDTEYVPTAAADISYQAVMVESQIGCWDTSCRVQAMRMVDRTRWLELEMSLNNMFWRTLPRLAKADVPNSNQSATQSQLTEAFIADQVTTAGTNGSWVQIDKLPKNVLSSRLQMAINTYWDASIGINVRSQSHDSAKTLPPVCFVSKRECKVNKLTWNATEVQTSQYDGEQYFCHSGYAVITIAISCFLFLAAVLSLLLGIVTTAPDILGFVSTAARDNVYFKDYVPSHLDGLEAARALKHVKVRIGDVAADEKVGHVAFASLESGPTRLTRERLYD